MSEDQGSIDKKVVECELRLNTLEKIREMCESLNVSEAQIISAAINYMHDVYKARRSGEKFPALVEVDNEYAALLKVFEPKIITNKYGKVQVLAPTE